MSFYIPGESDMRLSNKAATESLSDSVFTDFHSEEAIDRKARLIAAGDTNTFAYDDDDDEGELPDLFDEMSNGSCEGLTDFEIDY